MTFFENVARRPQVDRELVGLARSHHLRLLARIAVPSTDDSLGKVLREPVGPNVHQLRGEVGVGGGRFCIELK